MKQLNCIPQVINHCNFLNILSSEEERLENYKLALEQITDLLDEFAEGVEGIHKAVRYCGEAEEHDYDCLVYLAQELTKF